MKAITRSKWTWCIAAGLALMVTPFCSAQATTGAAVGVPPVATPAAETPKHYRWASPIPSNLMQIVESDFIFANQNHKNVILSKSCIPFYGGKELYLRDGRWVLRLRGLIRSGASVDLHENGPNSYQILSRAPYLFCTDFRYFEEEFFVCAAPIDKSNVYMIKVNAEDVKGTILCPGPNCFPQPPLPVSKVEPQLNATDSQSRPSDKSEPPKK